MELLQLKYFIEAAEREHFTEAAEALYITQPALSLSIQRMERELGATLFLRSGQGIRLNQNGRIFYQYAKRMLQELQDMQQELADMQQGLCGEVRFGTVQPVKTFGWLRPILDTYKGQHPNVQMAIFDGPQEVLLEILKERKLDFAITTGTVPSQYVHVPLYQDCMGILMSMNDDLAKNVELSVSEVLEKNFLLDNSDREMHARLEAAFAQYGRTPRIIFEGNRFAYILEAVSSGRGVTIMSEEYYNRCARQQAGEAWQQNTVFKVLRDPILCRSMGIAALSWEALQPAASSFCRKIMQNFDVKEGL